jgi:lipopolysaccharide/colanic/teichoic acid biosynthesis glycosyltransferase
MIVYVADTHAHVQRLVSVVKMAIVIEVCAIEEQRPVFFFVSRTECNNIHMEMFPIYGRKCLSRQAVHNWVEKRGKHLVDVTDVETEVQQ